jgi:hypothetical protein
LGIFFEQYPSVTVEKIHYDLDSNDYQTTSNATECYNYDLFSE